MQRNVDVTEGRYSLCLQRRKVCLLRDAGVLSHEVQRDDVVDGLSVRVRRDAHAANPFDRLDEPGAILDPVRVLLVELGELVDEENRVKDAEAVRVVERVHVRAQVRGEPVLVRPPAMLGSRPRAGS